MRLRGVASGALALIALEVVVTSSQTSRIAQLLTLPASWAAKLIDPSIPAIGDHSSAPAAARTAAPLPTAKLPGSSPNPVVTTGI